jgi:uncharacterized alkaline shock family protein YloU
MKDKKQLVSQAQGALSINGDELGLIHIHENVIASAVRKTIDEVEGVIRLSGSALVNNIAEIIGNKKIGDRAINVNIDGESVSIEVKVNMQYGVHVPTVAANIQTAVAKEVEKITGMKVTTVNVIVQELEEVETLPESTS